MVSAVGGKGMFDFHESIGTFFKDSSIHIHNYLNTLQVVLFKEIIRINYTVVFKYISL